MPEEEILGKRKKKNFPKHGGFDAAKNLNTALSGGAVEDYHTLDTRKFPRRVATKFIRDKMNPKSWYIKYVNITPAANINRPMEPIFNTAFSKNGTTGVPKFVELDVEWKDFAETFMMDQIAYSAMQQIRKALKSNLVYTDARIKACIINGVALLIYGKMLERDVHWNLYNGSSDFNFASMFRLQNQVVNTYGIVPLYPRNELLDINLPYTSTIYNKVVSLFNQVIKLPKNVSEFCSHYFGTLFTLDKDGHNDQYLRVNMHEIDWYNNNDPTQRTTLDLASLSLDSYLEYLNAYSKDFAVLLADLEKCLGVNSVKLSRYDEYTYAFVYDKSLLQALINGYTDNSAVQNNFIRLDKMEGVEDDLTQFLFLGGIQNSISTKADVRAIRILDMVLKCNSDNNIDWPKLLDQYPFTGGLDNQTIKLGNPFGLSIVTKFIVDDIITVASSESAQSTVLPLPTYPQEEPANSGNTSLLFFMGATAGTRFPASDYEILTDANHRSNHSLVSLIYLGATKYTLGGENYASYWFAYAAKNYAAIASDDSITFTKMFRFSAKGTHNQLRNAEQAISRDPRASAWFVDALDSDIGGSIMNHVNQLFSITAQGVTVTTYSSITPLSNPLSTQLYCKVNVSTSGDTFRAYDRVTITGTALTWSVTVSGSEQLSLVPDQQAAPNGLLVARNISVTTTLLNSNVDVVSVSYGEALPMFVSQVIDYHIPIYYNRRQQINVLVNGSAVFDDGQSSLPVLIKEDYVPYYYNVLDLIPVLYEMFVSLFSIDSIKRSY